MLRVEALQLVGAGRRGIRHGAPPLDENSAGPDRLGIDLRPEGASNGAHMRSPLQPFAPKDGLTRVRAARDDISAAHRVFERLDRSCVQTAFGQIFGAVGVARSDADLLEVADEWKGLQVRPPLHAGAEDRKDLSIFAREHACRDRGGAAGADRRDVGAIHHRQR